MKKRLGQLGQFVWLVILIVSIPFWYFFIFGSMFASCMGYGPPPGS